MNRSKGTTCVKCPKPRWKGPDGTNENLTMCEEHQREDWRRRGSERYARKVAAKKPGTAVRHRKPKAAVVTAPAPVEVKQPDKVIKVVLVDHKHDSVQRFDVPVLSGKKLSDVKNATRLLNFLRATNHVVIEIGKPEPSAVIELVEKTS